MNTLQPIQGEHYLHSDRIYRVDTVSSGTDEIVLTSVEDGSKYSVRYSVFKYGFKRVWKVGDVAKMIGRSPRSIYRYETKGQIRNPNRYPSRGGKLVRFYTKEDILEIHEMISEVHQGRPRKDGRVVNNTMPDRASLLVMFKERFGV